MENPAGLYDCAIIGGGLAGLCLSIQLADRGFNTVLFEKNKYPFHKVCGEYISMESWDFLVNLGLPLPELGLPVIDQLGISSEKGFMLNRKLGMGGFGISRYTLDHYLKLLAEKKGVTVLENCRVSAVGRVGGAHSEITTTAGEFSSRVVCGSYGKYTPSFVRAEEAQSSTSGINYIGVKYHVKTDLPPNRIELHNFNDGYCGISMVDNGWQCLCYLTTAKNLQDHGKDIRSMEENVLFRNPHLKKYFTQAGFISQQPLVVSNVHFRKKGTFSNDIFLLGDAAGSITPLCGNGMSMAMRASKILATELSGYLGGLKSMEEAISQYRKTWNAAFNTRITAGYYLQSLFGKRKTTDYALKFLDKTPFLTDSIVSLTHGDRF